MDRDQEAVNVLSLFSGIGGLDLGLERAGMTIVGQVEIDPWCRKVLAKHWPEVPRHDDVRTAADWWGGRPVPALIAGGFPCQDVSDAHTNGVRTALAGAKSGLWHHFAAIVGALRPRWVLAENVDAWRRWVPGVRADLAGLGYASVPLEVSAGSRGAPHERPRVFVVAHADGQGESLRAIHAQVAGLSPVPRTRGNWRQPFTGPVRVDDGLPRRMDRLRGLGNAVVPQVAERIGRLIMSAQANEGGLTMNCESCWHLLSLHGLGGCTAKVYPAHSLTGEPCPCGQVPGESRYTGSRVIEQAGKRAEQLFAMAEDPDFLGI